ncbi:MAG: CDP-alcohol phosphatidyltransferase family protein [Spirochaetales bacterium]|jgi:phosphatidylglycerophosphate synthase|nr:CDP-alcohol phosphatidyltransferase family protein [Spirochaetales bacterium]
MKYSLKDVTASLTPEKHSADGFWTRCVLRPLSYPVAWLALRCALSPNTVSWTGVFFAVAGAVLFGLAGGVFRWAGIAGFFIFSVLDCVDGNMARTIKKPSPWGAWTDTVSGYIVYTAALLSLGVAAERAGGFDGPVGLCIFLGGFSAAANMLMRAAVQARRVSAFTITASVAGTPAQQKPGREKWISENAGVTGVMVPAMCAGVYFGKLHWALFFYTLLYGIGSVWIVFRLAVKNKNRD